MKTSELTGTALDWAVSKADNPPGKEGSMEWWERDSEMYLFDPLNERRYSPSTDWLQGGPIIERERIEIKRGNPLYFPKDTVEIDNYYELLWLADKHYGPTPLIAAMRAYVASKLGNEVEIPEELE
jgi:hypothetical protein